MNNKLHYPQNLICDILEEVITLNEDNLKGLDHAIHTLTEREIKALYYRYVEGLTLKQAGEKFGVTQERVRQILAKAARKLRHPARKRFIVNGYDATVQQIEEETKKARIDLNFDEDEKGIEHLDLSVRSYNCLRRAGISTIKNLIDFINNDGDFAKIRNMGRKSANEITSRMSEYTKMREGCQNCRWKERHQKCSCCKRNKSIKDNYEKEGGVE